MKPFDMKQKTWIFDFELSSLAQYNTSWRLWLIFNLEWHFDLLLDVKRSSIRFYLYSGIVLVGNSVSEKSLFVLVCLSTIQKFFDKITKILFSLLLYWITYGGIVTITDPLIVFMWFDTTITKIKSQFGIRNLLSIEKLILHIICVQWMQIEWIEVWDELNLNCNCNWKTYVYA